MLDFLIQLSMMYIVLLFAYHTYDYWNKTSMFYDDAVVSSVIARSGWNPDPRAVKLYLGHKKGGL